jgi:broad specificity phosphatase PhoE
LTATLLLIRHGETDWNVEGRYQGQDGPGINETGRKQARDIAYALNSCAVSAMYSSDLIRTMETAYILGKSLDLPVRSDARLREIHQGKWQRMLYREIEQQFPEQLKQFRDSPLRCSPPEGETLECVTQRVLAALDDIAVQHPNQHVAVVTHKLPIAIVRCLLNGVAPTHVWRALPANAQMIPVIWPQEVCWQHFDLWLRESI